MEIAKELLPVSAILVVILSMSMVDVFIIGEPLRVLSTAPIIFVLILWLVATIRVRRDEDVR